MQLIGDYPKVLGNSVQVIAVDADSVNLAYLRKSLERNALWENAAVRLINNAVRFVKPRKPFLPAVLTISFRFLAITYSHKNIKNINILNLQ